MKLRAPAVPLVTYDPYFSIWSMSDSLNDDPTRHWTSVPHPLTGEVTLNEKIYRFMGVGDSDAMQQISVDVTPMSTAYRFRCPGLELAVTFTTPLLLDDLTVLSRPVTYLAIQAFPDNKAAVQDLRVTLVIDDAICLGEKGEQDTVYTPFTCGTVKGAKVGGREQKPLSSCGDLVCIQWGYVYAAVRQPAAVIAPISGRNKNGTCFHNISIDIPLETDEQQTVIALAYDDIQALEYFHTPLELYWKKEAPTLERLLEIALDEYESLKERCDNFDRQLCEDATEAGSGLYAELLSLAYRQSVAAHNLCEDSEGELLFISKECGSGACAATVDVSYPSMPLFLLYNPRLVEAMMRPIFRYARSDAWPYPFAPHDAGYYPLLNGQTYGMEMERQMPVEECSNMLLMTAAAALASGDISFARKNWDLLEQWCGYLLEHGYDPENQLCTDDFAGHLAHNCNLSLKFIMSIAGFALLCKANGMPERWESLVSTARALAVRWIREASNEDGTFRLAFDQPNTFSLKYNAVWDQLFNTEIFPPHTFDTELRSYMERAELYGMPLDCREAYTKSDWLVWCAAMLDRREDFVRMIEPLWKFYHESPTRFAMGDWYYTTTAQAREFQNRSVQGGLFIGLLKEKGLKKGEKVEPVLVGAAVR